MGTVLLWVGRLAGIGGVLLCLMAGALRFRSVYNFAGFQIGTLLLAGIAAMLVGCLAYLALMVERPGK
jgi:hypothetical protein